MTAWHVGAVDISGVTPVVDVLSVRGRIAAAVRLYTDRPVLDARQTTVACKQLPLLNSHTAGGVAPTVVERRSLTGELSLSCARPAADG